MLRKLYRLVRPVLLSLLSVLGVASLPRAAPAADWPMWAGSPSRNMAAAETGLPSRFFPGLKEPDGQFNTKLARNLKWIARLGTLTRSSPVVANGKIYIGTNNGYVRDPRFQGDYGLLLCLDEATGRCLWQLSVPAIPPLRAAKISFPNLGMCSSPAIEGDRAYLVTNRCEAVCLTTQGLVPGNQGPFLDEAGYYSRPAEQSLGPSVTREAPGFHLKFGQPVVEVTPAVHPVTLTAADADIVWRYDMMNNLAIWPHEAAASSPLIYGDLLFMATGNGVDSSHHHIPSPMAPTFVAINKNTGLLVGADDLHIAPRILHGTWSSPTLATIGERTLVVIGGPDGICYAFNATPAPPVGDSTVGKLEPAWWYDCNPPAARYTDRKAVAYPNPKGPSEIIATPVFYKDRIYVAIGQDTRHGAAPGLLLCIDPTGSGNITDKGKVWQYDQISRSLSTVAIADGLLTIVDVSGKVHCLDAETGKFRWSCDTNSLTCGSTLVADGRVYFGNDKGELWVLAAKDGKLLLKVNLGSPIHSTPVAANGVLYVATCTNLFAFQEKDKPAATQPSELP